MEMCIYCQKNPANTIDHVPSQGLFPDTHDVDFIKVPACSDCNRGFSADEEYFRNFTANISISSSTSADLLFNTKIKRSVERRPGLALKLFKRMSLVQVSTSNGINLGPMTKVDIVDEDRGRIASVVQKYIKALFFKHLGVPFPSENKMRVVWLTPENKAVITRTIGIINLVGKFKDVFAYGYGQTSSSQNSVWVLEFFNNLSFIVFVTTPEFDALNGR